MNIKIEPGSNIQITDKPIVNVFGDVNILKEHTPNGQSAANSENCCWNSCEEETGGSEGSADQRIRTCVDKLLEEKVMVHLYDYTWVMEVMNQTDGLPHFNTPQSFINYMNDLGIEKMPSDSTINKKQNVFSGSFPDWKFTDCDSTEANRRINVAKRFLNIYRKLAS